MAVARIVLRPLLGSHVVEELAEIDPDTLTPREALDALYRLRKRLDD